MVSHMCEQYKVQCHALLSAVTCVLGVSHGITRACGVQGAVPCIVRCSIVCERCKAWCHACMSKAETAHGQGALRMMRLTAVSGTRHEHWACQGQSQATNESHSPESPESQATQESRAVAGHQ